MQKLPTKLWPFFFHFMKKNPIAFAILFLAPSILIAESVAMPYAIKMIVDAFTNNENNREDIFEIITPAVYLFISSWVAMLVVCRLQEWLQVYIIPKFEANIRMSVIDYISDHSFNYFNNRLSGNIANKISDLPRAIESLRISLCWRFVGTFVPIVAFLVIVSYINTTFTIIIIGWITAHLTISFIFVRIVDKAAEKNAEYKSNLSGKIVDVISNIISVKLFSRKKFEYNNIFKTQKDEIKSNAKLKFSILAFRTFIDMPSILIWVIVGYYIIEYWQKELITTGDLIFLFNGIWTIMIYLWFLGEDLSEMFKNAGIIRQALELIKINHEITDKVDAKELTVKEGKIKFNEVSFYYNEGKNIFENKNVIINPGEKVGLVGFSGAGKSTFVNLILRMHDVESGAISIDDQDIRTVTQDSLRENIAVIPQDTSLFHRTLFENIHYGNIDANEKEVINAAKLADCHEFISRLPQGYNTLVGERGVKLSGGQRQRIAIARAILKNAPILILDEATSSLDSMTEKSIQKSLNELMQGKTTIVIAHRLSTLLDMNRILVFDKGHIIEDGSHNELLKQNGHYAKLWSMQAGGFLPDEEN